MPHLATRPKKRTGQHPVFLTWVEVWTGKNVGSSSVNGQFRIEAEQDTCFMPDNFFCWGNTPKLVQEGSTPSFRLPHTAVTKLGLYD